MLRPVEDEDFTRYSFRRNQVWVVRHITGAIDFARVVDPLNDLHAGLWGETVAPELASFIVVVRSVQPISRRALVALREMNSGNLKVVLRLARRVCAKKDAVDSVGLAGGSGAS